MKNAFIAKLADSWTVNNLSQEPFWQWQKKHIRRRWQVFLRSLIVETRNYQSVSILQSVLVWTPASILIVTYIYQGSLIEAAAILVVLPRVIELLLDVSNFVMDVMEISFIKGRLQWLDDNIIPPTASANKVE